MTLKNSYLRKEVSVFTGIEARTLQDYTDRGLIRPEIDDRRGKGAKRRYSVKNIFQFFMLRKIIESGIPLAGNEKDLAAILEVTAFQFFKPDVPENVQIKIPINKRIIPFKHKCLVLQKVKTTAEWRKKNNLPEKETMWASGFYETDDAKLHGSFDPETSIQTVILNCDDVVTKFINCFFSDPE